MKMKTKDILLYILLTLIIGQISSISTHASSIGDNAPLFSLRDIYGRAWPLEDLKGKVVFINFWATWCTPCRKELPMLNELQKKSKDVVVLAVNIDKKRSNVESFLKGYSLNIPILLDPDSRVVANYGAWAMPTSFILDRDGRIRFIHFGFDKDRDPGLWEKEINEISGGRV